MEPFDQQLAPEPIEEQSAQSALGRYFNVIASPSEAFGGITSLEKKTSLWLVPMIIGILLSMGMYALTMTNPEIQQEIRQKMDEKTQQMVQSGKYTQQQAEQAMQMGSSIQKVAPYVGMILGIPLAWLLLAGVYYVIMSFVLGGETTYQNIFVAYSLTSAIVIIEGIIGSLLKYATGSLATEISLGFLVSADGSAALHALLGKINPFTFWWLAVLSLGCAKVSNLTFKKAAIGVLGLWVVYCGISVWFSTLDIAKSFSF
ncbi:MAG TPA: Yip1 family protein [Candidatus Kapabacteria bacterium]|nr:Yip1 family protein [Candidatus Kapabacteria bacterium]